MDKLMTMIYKGPPLHRDLHPRRRRGPGRRRHQGRVRGRHPAPDPDRRGHDVHGAYESGTGDARARFHGRVI